MKAGTAMIVMKGRIAMTVMTARKAKAASKAIGSQNRWLKRSQTFYVPKPICGGWAGLFILGRFHLRFEKE